MRTPEAGGRARGFDRPAPAEVAAWGGARDKLALEAQVGTLIDAAAEVSTRGFRSRAAEAERAGRGLD